MKYPPKDFGVSTTVNLIPNGANVPVTADNRLRYIYLVSHYRLTRQIRQQSEAFFEGLSEIVDPKWLRMFNQQELKTLVGGAEEEIDMDDLRKWTVYGGLYDDRHPTIEAFWRVSLHHLRLERTSYTLEQAVKSLDQAQRRGLLRFVTSCSRPPLLYASPLLTLQNCH